MLSALMSGFLLGFSTGIYCIGVCVPALMPYLVFSGWHGIKASLRTVGEFLIGRFVAYAIIGVLVGVLGAKVYQHAVIRIIGGVIITALAMLLIAHGIAGGFPEWHPCERLLKWLPLRRFPLLAGVALGFNPCPPLLLCFSSAVALGNVLASVAMCLAFAVGTSVFMLPLALSAYLGRWEGLRGMARIAAIFAGLWFATYGILLFKQAWK